MSRRPRPQGRGRQCALSGFVTQPPVVVAGARRVPDPRAEADVARPRLEPAAAAKPVENGHFQESESEEFDDFCGDMSVLAEHEASGHFIGKAQGEDGLIHFSANVRGTDPYTNLATDKTFIIEFSFNDKDQSVTDNGDGTLTILFKSAGIQKAFGPDGEWLFLDAGAGWAELLIDHGGTPTDPSDDEFISADAGKLSGRFDTAGRDFCEDFRAITS